MATWLLRMWRRHERVLAAGEVRRGDHLRQAGLAYQAAGGRAATGPALCGSARPGRALYHVVMGVM